MSLKCNKNLFAIAETFKIPSIQLIICYFSLGPEVISNNVFGAT